MILDALNLTPSDCTDQYVRQTFDMGDRDSQISVEWKRNKVNMDEVG